MNTIQLTINKRKVTFTLGLIFIGEMLDKYETSVEELFTKVDRNPFKWLPLTMYESAKATFDLDGKQIDFTYKEFINDIEQDGGVGGPAATEFTIAFVKSMVKDVPLEEEETKDGGNDENTESKTEEKKS